MKDFVSVALSLSLLLILILKCRRPLGAAAYTYDRTASDCIDMHVRGTCRCGQDMEDIQACNWQLQVTTGRPRSLLERFIIH